MSNRRLDVKDESTIVPFESFFYHVLFGANAYVFYRIFMFAPLENHTMLYSKIILILCIGVASTVGTLIRWRKHMTFMAVLAEVVAGDGLYTMIAYGEFYQKRFRLIISLFLAWSVLYAFAALTRKVGGKSVWRMKRPEVRSLILRTRISRILHVSGLFFGVLMLLTIIPVGCRRSANKGIAQAREVTASDAGQGFSWNAEFDLEHNIDTIEKIRDNERWKPLSLQEKLNVLQTIANCEENYFGMDYQIRVIVDDFEDGCVGTYSEEEKIVRIDRSYLQNGSAEEALNVILHEMYHAYEHRLIDLYLDASEEQRKLRVFWHCAEYLEELKDYKSDWEDSESFLAYYNQYMEQDSRAYAEDAVIQYYYQIDRLQGMTVRE